MNHSDNTLDNICSAFLHEMNGQGLVLIKDEIMDGYKHIRDQYEDPKNKALKEHFPKFVDFFNELLFISYGLKIDEKKAERGIIHFRTEGSEKEKTSLSKIDMFQLSKYLSLEYPWKGVLYDFLTKDDGLFYFYDQPLFSPLDMYVKTEDWEKIFQISYEHNFWDNIYRGENKETISPQQILSSALHAACPAIHYLHFADISNLTPLCTAVLIEAQLIEENDPSNKSATRFGLNQSNYLLLDTLYGDFSSFKPYKTTDGKSSLDKKISLFIWDAICYFAYKRKREVMLNLSQLQENIFAQEFLQQVLSAYSVDPAQTKRVSCYLSIQGNVALKHHISLKKKDTFVYDNEQQIMAFSSDHNKREITGSLSSLEGYAQVFKFKNNPKNMRPSVNGLSAAPIMYPLGTTNQFDFHQEFLNLNHVWKKNAKPKPTIIDYLWRKITHGTKQ